MPRSLQAYLWDIEAAAGDILAFTRGKRLDDYQSDAMLRAAVERNFEIIGEALSQALKCAEPKAWSAARSIFLFAQWQCDASGAS